MGSSSLRYGGGVNDLRSAFLKLCGKLQGKDVVIVNSDLKLCAEVLASENKGTFVEHLIATPAWSPIISTESVSGDAWKNLSHKFKIIMGKIRWRERVNPISKKYIQRLLLETKGNPEKKIDSEEVSRIALRILFELLFEVPISKVDEELFYEASMEWRKEIGMKGRGKAEIKKAFWARLSEVVDQSSFGDLFKDQPHLHGHGEKDAPEQGAREQGAQEKGAKEREFWLSAFAQPFLVGPQINVSDIMVSVFHYLRAEPEKMELAKQWAHKNDKARLGGVLFEAIRLKHPFPILEREFEKGDQISGRTLKAKTQFFLVFDRFQQDPEFNPERWLKSNSENPYHGIPFGTGPRMCMGKPVAVEILTELLKGFLTEFQTDQIQPQLGHLYSGRDNDQNAGFSESIYQLKTIAKGVWKSWSMGRRNKVSPVESTGCPFKRTMQQLGIQ